MQLQGFSPLTLLDYPGLIACTIFTGGCNFRCPFCHNASLVLHPANQPALEEDTVINRIAARKKLIEGICVTGGEPTLNPDLPDFLSKLKDLGLKIKLDSNGTNPQMLERVISEGLVDCIAMDIKSSPCNYSLAAGLKNLNMDNIFASVELLLSGSIDYEFRTTVVDGIHTADDFRQIGVWIKGAKKYYLQQYKKSEDLIAGEGLSSPTAQTLEAYRQILLPNIPSTFVRGAD